MHEPKPETVAIEARSPRGRCSGLRRLDRAHAPVVVWCTSRTSIGARSRVRPPTSAMGATGVRPAEGVRLVHELGQLRGPERTLQRSHDRPDVDDRLRRDRVDVLRRHALTDDALHPVEADAERLLDQLADRAQAPVAETLVLVELAPNRLARAAEGIGGVVLRLGINAELGRQVDEPLDERDDVLRRQDAGVFRDVDVETLVQLVAADLREVVALRVEEEPRSRLRALSRVGGSPGRC